MDAREWWSLAAIGLAVGTAALLVAAVVWEVLRTTRAARKDLHRWHGVDAILPVGYTTDDDGAPSPRYASRLDLACKLWDETGAPIWSLAGRLRNRSRSIAEDTKRYLQARGIPAEAIRIIDEFPFLGESLETIQEAEVTSELARRLRARRLAVVSDVIQLAQFRLVLPPTLDAVLIASPLIPPGQRFEPYYVSVRCAALLATMLDRRGRLLAWLRVWRRGTVHDLAMSLLRRWGFE